MTTGCRGQGTEPLSCYGEGDPTEMVVRGARVAVSHGVNLEDKFEICAKQWPTTMMNVKKRL